MLIVKQEVMVRVSIDPSLSLSLLLFREDEARLHVIEGIIEHRDALLHRDWLTIMERLTASSAAEQVTHDRNRWFGLRSITLAMSANVLPASLSSDNAP